MREKIAELSERAREKNCAIFKIEEDSTPPLNSFLAPDLFGQKIFLIAKGLLENSERSSEAKALARDMAEAENIIVFIERELSEAWEKIFSKAGATVKEFKKPTAVKFYAWLSKKAAEFGLNLSSRDLDLLISEAGADPFALVNKLERLSLSAPEPLAKRREVAAVNYFNFADAASGKRKHQALSLLRSYVRDGLGAEEAFWKLWWKIKTLRLVDSGKKATGLHPFVEKKALEDLRYYSREELRKISFELMDLFSSARRGEENFEEGLEKILLKS